MSVQRTLDDLRVLGEENATYASRAPGALRKIDPISCNMSVINRSTTAQPSSPSGGDAYLIKATATGTDWTGQDAKVTIFSNNYWHFIAPFEGMTLWVSDDNELMVYNGTDWSLVRSGSSTYSSPRTEDIPTLLSATIGTTRTIMHEVIIPAEEKVRLYTDGGWIHFTCLLDCRLDNGHTIDIGFVLKKGGADVSIAQITGVDIAINRKMIVRGSMRCHESSGLNAGSMFGFMELFTGGGGADDTFHGFAYQPGTISIDTDNSPLRPAIDIAFSSGASGSTINGDGFFVETVVHDSVHSQDVN